MRGPAPDLSVEEELLGTAPFVVACDEVGRGALAGPVAIGAVVVDAARAAGPVPEGVRDSKLVTERRRPEVARIAADWACAHAVGWASAEEIDRLGIVAALGLAGARALADLERQGFPSAAGVVLLDGSHDYLSAAVGPGVRVRSRVKADRDCVGVAAASVLAKVARDELMVRLGNDWPAYGWERNKGYGSAVHREAIGRHGITPHHRASWVRATPLSGA